MSKKSGSAPNPILITDLTVEYQQPSALIPYAGNARTHTRKQVAATASSIQEFGWTNPILVTASKMVIAGHCRLEAAKLLGMDLVPTISINNLSEAQIKGYILADNALAEQAGWSTQQLRTELQGLSDMGFDLELTMLGSVRIDTLLSFDGDEARDIDDIVALPSEKPPVSRLGDHWTVGGHHLVCDDARLPASYERLLDGELAQVVVADAPYGCAIRGNVSGLGKVVHDDFVMGSNGLNPAEFVTGLLRPTFRCIAANCAPGAIGYFFIDWRADPLLLDAAEGVFEKRMNMAVWSKTNASLGSFYRSQHELIEIFKITKGPHINNFRLQRHRSNVWIYPGANSFRAGRKQDLIDHPTVKPKKMIADALKDCSHRGGIVLDPFAGSSTTLVAAEMTGRRGYGLELDPRYVDVGLRRLQEITGKVPLLDGKTPFDEVAAMRGVEPNAR